MVTQITSSTNNKNVQNSTVTKVATRAPSSATLVNVVEKKQLQEQQRRDSYQSHSGVLAQTAKANHKLAKSQSSLSALRNASDLLGQLRVAARRTLNSHESKKTQHQQTLQQLKSKLTKLTSEASYGEEKLLNYDLTPKISTASAVESFSIKGIRFNQHREQSEVLRFQFEQGEPKSVKAKIEPYDTLDEVITTLNKAFSKRSMSVSADRFGELQFHVSKELWPATQKGMWVSGSGQILPSGNPIKAKIENLDKQQVSVDKLDFSKAETTRKTLADIDRIMAKIEQSIVNIEKKQQELAQKLEQFYQKSTAVDAGQILKQNANVTVNFIGNAVPTLLAQANATRHNVTALLEPVN